MKYIVILTNGCTLANVSSQELGVLSRWGMVNKYEIEIDLTPFIFEA